MFSRPRDPERSPPSILALGEKHYGFRAFRDEDGYTLRDWAFGMGCWYLERWWGFGNIVGDEGLYKWFPERSKIVQRDRLPPGERWEVADPEVNARCCAVKRPADRNSRRHPAVTAGPE